MHREWCDPIEEWQGPLQNTFRCLALHIYVQLFFPAHVPKTKMPTRYVIGQGSRDPSLCVHPLSYSRSLCLSSIPGISRFLSTVEFPQEVASCPGNASEGEVCTWGRRTSLWSGVLWKTVNSGCRRSGTLTKIENKWIATTLGTDNSCDKMFM